MISGSDDSTVRMWDLPTGQNIFTIRDATDYVRAQAPSPASKHVWCVGSYDRSARVYDLRTRKALFTLDHGHQIDDVLILPGGARAITVGGPDVKVWDFFAGARLMSRLSNHAKAVTCCAAHPVSERLLTGGLDGQIKVHDLTAFDVTAVVYYQGPIVSVAVSPDGERLGTGRADGVAEIRVTKGFDRRVRQALPGAALKERQFEGWGRGFEKPPRDEPHPGTRRYFERGAKAKPAEDDVVVRTRSRGVKMAHDRHLRAFAYAKALDAAVFTHKPEVLLSVVDELIARKALRNAVSGLDSGQLGALLKVVKRYIDLPHFTGRLSQVCNVILDVHADAFGRGSKNDVLLKLILKKVRNEVGVRREMSRLQGCLECIMNVAEMH